MILTWLTWLTWLACSAPPPATEPPSVAAQASSASPPSAAPSSAEADLHLGPFGLRELDETELIGVCEPSAGVRIEGGFLLAEDDRSKSLVRFATGATVGEPFKHREAGQTIKLKDLEAAAGSGARSWWLTSHSKPDPERSRLALALNDGADIQGCVSLAGLNTPGALQALLDRSQVTCPDCRVAEGFEALGSKEGGLDVEALAIQGGAESNGVRAPTALFLGLRGPTTTDGRALALRVDDLAVEAALRPCEDNAPLDLSALTAYALDLGPGRGLRALEGLPPGDGLLGVAGPVSSRGDFSLIHWVPETGALSQLPLPVPEGTAPEALFIELTDGDPALTLLFDAGQRVETQHKDDTKVDGKDRSQGCDCESLAEGRCERDGAPLPVSAATAPMRRYQLIVPEPDGAAPSAQGSGESASPAPL